MCGSAATQIEAPGAMPQETGWPPKCYPQTEMAPMESWIPEGPFTWASRADIRAYGIQEAVQEVRGELTTFTTAQKAEESSRREPQGKENSQV